VPELAATHRECFVYSYRMIYRVEQNHVLIITVIHGKRLLELVDPGCAIDSPFAYAV